MVNEPTVFAPNILSSAYQTYKNMNVYTAMSIKFVNLKKKVHVVKSELFKELTIET